MRWKTRTRDEEGEEEGKEPGRRVHGPVQPVLRRPRKPRKTKPRSGPGTPAANQTFKDSSDAANEILRKLMERRRASKS